MTFLTNTAEGGTAGTAATISNTGGSSGNAFTAADQQVLSPNTGVWEFSSIRSHENVGYRVQGTSVRSYFSWNSGSFTASKMLTQRFYVRIPAAPSAAVQIMQLRNSTGQAAALNVTTGRNLQLTNAPGVGLWTAASAMAVDTWYRVELAITAGTTTTNGVVDFAYYSLDSMTPIQTFTATNVDLGTTNIVDVRWGKVSSTGTFEVFLDSLKIDSSSTTFLGPHIVAVASLRPAASVSNPGAWSNVGGAASNAAALADETDTTYCTTGANPANATETFSMNGTLDTGPVTVKVRANIDTAGVAGTLVVDLMQGATLIATRTFNLVNAVTDFSFVTTTAETNAITNRSDLRIRYTANQT